MLTAGVITWEAPAPFLTAGKGEDKMPGNGVFPDDLFGGILDLNQDGNTDALEWELVCEGLEECAEDEEE